MALKTKNDLELEFDEPLRFLQCFVHRTPICDMDTCTDNAINFFGLANGKAVALCSNCEFLFTNIDYDHSPYGHTKGTVVYGGDWHNSGSLGLKLKEVFQRMIGEDDENSRKNP